MLKVFAMRSRNRSRFRGGDTIVEVMVAFAVFAALAMATTTIMNRSVAAGQRSLETTLVRQQIDTQADLLRFARDRQLPAWNQIKSNLSSADPGPISPDQCPAGHGDLPSRSFFMNSTATAVERRAISTANYSPAPTYSRINTDNPSVPRSEGLWILPRQVQTSDGSVAYDMYIRACWYSVGQSRPMTLSTIVRLYET